MTARFEKDGKGYSRYRSLEIRIQETGDRLLRVEVIDSRKAKVSQGTVELDLSENEWQRAFERVQGRFARQDQTPEGMAELQKLGHKLFERMFQGDLATAVRMALDLPSGTGLRLFLNLGSDSRLGALPWECLFDHDTESFLSLSRGTPLIRLAGVGRGGSLKATLPLRLLIIGSAPSDYPRLDLEKEYSLLVRALDPLAKRGLVRFERARSGRWGDLQESLNDGSFQVLHFMGHGARDRWGRACVVLETDQGCGDLLDQGRFIEVVRDHPSLRLVVLGCCQNPWPDQHERMSELPFALLRAGLPAAVVMRSVISDLAAIYFSSGFYQELARSGSVEHAISEGRRSIFLRARRDLDWAVPALFTRSKETRLFRISSAEPGVREVVPAPPIANPWRFTVYRTVPGKLNVVLEAGNAAKSVREVAWNNRWWSTRLDPLLFEAFSYEENSGESEKSSPDHLDHEPSWQKAEPLLRETIQRLQETLFSGSQWSDFCPAVELAGREDSTLELSVKIAPFDEGLLVTPWEMLYDVRLLPKGPVLSLVRKVVPDFIAPLLPAGDGSTILYVGPQGADRKLEGKGEMTRVTSSIDLGRKLMMNAYSRVHLQGAIRRSKLDQLWLEVASGEALSASNLVQVLRTRAALPALVTLVTDSESCLGLSVLFASQLVRLGLPAVLTSFVPFSPEKAELFFGCVHEQVAERGVCEAVRLGRARLFQNDQGGGAWRNPVLFVAEV